MKTSEQVSAEEMHDPVETAGARQGADHYEIKPNVWTASSATAPGLAVLAHERLRRGRAPCAEYRPKRGLRYWRCRSKPSTAMARLNL